MRLPGSLTDWLRPAAPGRFGRRSAIGAVIASICVVGLCGSSTHAQRAQDNIALKSGESAELGIIYYVSNCRSVMVGLPVIEILEGPPELTLSIKEGEVLPRRLKCANKVAGGTVVATAKDVKEPIHTKLTYRLKYKTRDGDRQVAHVFNVSLFP
jgi:hypothetical protein